jgi:hypothetical protein
LLLGISVIYRNPNTKSRNLWSNANTTNTTESENPAFDARQNPGLYCKLEDGIASTTSTGQMQLK